MSAQTAAAAASRAGERPIRVMVVDDSGVARSLMGHWLAAEPDIAVVASLRSGREAVDWIARGEADVAVLDIEMPDLDGLSALPQLLARRRDLVIIMASTLTRRNAEISLKALSLGAADYVTKPETGRGGGTAAAFRRDLIAKVRVGGQRHRVVRWPRPSLHVPGTAAPPGIESVPLVQRIAPALAKAPPQALVVGASTGGPQALEALVPALRCAAARVPVLIVQHMPPTFTTILAEHLARASGIPAREAQHGESLVNGTLYVAPGGRHLCAARRGGLPVAVLDDGPPLNFCKPAVDVLFRSAGEVWGARTLGIILTGMGVDGTEGGHALVDGGGVLLAQDEATSAVWGMPGSAAQAGLCTAVLPLGEIGEAIARIVTGDRT
ncbi:MAG: chemotaxis response regulator protein-glutamate methylesterase [Rhizobiales bacterium]|nr:chemotaxis response regulator protein-glutamate methylesterase [Hyphomicrobiales bacterium]